MEKIALKNDKALIISVANQRYSTNWQPSNSSLSELYTRLEQPIRGAETLAQYLKLKKVQQDDLKDVGGFVAGRLNSSHRKNTTVVDRCIVTLDFDTIPPYGTDGVLQAVENMGCGFCVYSTRKHMPTAPRLRILIPLDRTVTADEYEPMG